MSLGKQIEDSGWRQFSVVESESATKLMQSRGINWSPYHVLIAISQSCDLTHFDLKTEPFVEFIWGECNTPETTEAKTGNYQFGKNPRQLHIEIPTIEGESQVFAIKASNRFQIPREDLLNLKRDNERTLRITSQSHLRKWLAARYDRLAVPTSLDIRLRSVKWEKFCKKAHQIGATGIYARIYPESELDDSEIYELIILVSAKDQDFVSALKTDLEEVKQAIKSKSVNLTYSAKLETKITMAQMRDMRLMPIEHISTRDDERNTPVKI